MMCAVMRNKCFFEWPKQPTFTLTYHPILLHLQNQIHLLYLYHHLRTCKLPIYPLLYLHHKAPIFAHMSHTSQPRTPIPTLLWVPLLSMVWEQTFISLDTYLRQFGGAKGCVFVYTHPTTHRCLSRSKG